MTFSLPGFSTVKRDGVEITGTFVATINGELKVGALEETITVTGETPIVDVQSAKVQQTVSKDVLAAIPTSRNAAGIQALIPGMSNATDSGGINGSMTGGAGSIHGGRGNDSRTYSDGNNTGWAGGSAGGGNTPNVAGAQEVVLSTSGGLGEAETSGVILNVIPRDGSNNFSGQFSVSGANGAMQGSNYTQSLKDQGLKTPSELNSLYDVNPMGGGRIIRDKLWFYLTYRQTASDRTVPGMWINKNAGNPNAWTVDFDRDKPAFNDSLDRNGIARITWQVTPRNKISAHWSEQYTSSSVKGGGTGTTTPEASTVHLVPALAHQLRHPGPSPLTSRLLMEAGWGSYQSRYRNPGPRVDGTFNPRMIRAQTQDGEIPNLISRQPAGVGGGFNHHLIGALANLRASTSYVTGAHNMKFGYQGGFGNPSQEYTYYNEVILVRINGGVANRLTQVVSEREHQHQDRPQPDSDLVLRAGSVDDRPADAAGRHPLRPPAHHLSRISSSAARATTPRRRRRSCIRRARPRACSWDDVSVRTGAAYDLFGNGKTAVKFNLGKYMEAFSATNTDLDLNPLIRNTISTTRTWTDTNKDFVPNCNLANKEANGECAAMDNKNLGTANFTRSYDTDFVTGSGVRPYNWGLGLSVQQEVLPRVSVNVGYFRNWWGNWYAVDNRAIDREPTSPRSASRRRSIRGCRAAAATRSTASTTWIPTKVGQIDELATASSNFGKHDRELAGRGRQRRRAAAQRPDDSGRHEHRPPASGRVRRAREPARVRCRRRRVRTTRSPVRRTGNAMNVDQPVLPRSSEPYRPSSRGWRRT